MNAAYGKNVQPKLWPSGWIAFALDQIKVIAHIDGFRQKNEAIPIYGIEEIRRFIFDHCCSPVERTWTAWPCFSNTNHELWAWFWIFNYKRCEISQPDTAITLRMGRWTQLRIYALALKWTQLSKQDTIANAMVNRSLIQIGMIHEMQNDLSILEEVM